MILRGMLSIIHLATAAISDWSDVFSGRSASQSDVQLHFNLCARRLI